MEVVCINCDVYCRQVREHRDDATGEVFMTDTVCAYCGRTELWLRWQDQKPPRTPSHLSHPIGWCDMRRDGWTVCGPSQLRQHATQSATQRDMRRAAKGAELRRSNVSSGSMMLTRLSSPTDFHIRCSIHRKCPHSARFCDHDCCLDPISAPIGRSVLVVNRSAPSTRRSSFARGSPALVSDRVGDRITTPKKTGGGCRVG
jgi:hypothetical protein